VSDVIGIQKFSAPQAKKLNFLVLRLTAADPAAWLKVKEARPL